MKSGSGWRTPTIVRVMLFIALILCASLAFTAIAGAKYAGFTPMNPDPNNMAPGMISFDMAQQLMVANNVPAGLQTTAHGGYITTTTKCAVCHSIHRATGIPDTSSIPAGPLNQKFLTAGGAECTACHTTWGSQSTVLLVEWGQPDGGPHASPSRGCGACHGGGIHGTSNSGFYVMNKFMLGEGQDADLTAELPQLALRGQGAFYVPPILTGGTDYNPSTGNSPSAGNTWWWDGGASQNAGVAIGAPVQIGGLPGDVFTVSPRQYAAARSVATSYVCTQSGCHVNTVMANLQWGVAFNRDITGTANMVQTTAHALPALGVDSGTWTSGASGRTSGCGPCHPGNAAGFPTDSVSAISRYAYGCDQCHDMIGVATNSTAFPHGNRGIKVYEWVQGAGQTQTMIETDITSGNLWMYAGNAALGVGQTPAGTGITQFADLNYRVLQGVTSGAGPLNPTTQYWGEAETLADGLAAAAAVPGYGGLTDGSCLKCHIPIDSASMSSMESTALAATRNHNPNRVDSLGNPTGSARIFLYR